MFLASITSGSWQANCYVVAEPGLEKCVIIDPGQDSAAQVRSLLAENRLEPRAILLTHGHFDHVADASTLADEFNIATYIHAADQHLLRDPAAGLTREGGAMVRKLTNGANLEPARVENFSPAEPLTLAGLTFTVAHAPGHTAGSVLLSLAYRSHPAINQIVFTGDVVFAGSVGRTDLPGGDPDAMRDTLSDVVCTLASGSALLPGHGQQTTIDVELTTNPYLQPTFLRN